VKRSKKSGILIVLILTVAISVISFAQETFAASRDYTINDGKRVPIPETYVLKKVINNIGSKGEEPVYLKEPEDLFINSQGYIFIADTGNNRIVKITSDGELVDIFKGSPGKLLKAPKGVYADDNGNMYIADTGNLRIVHLSSEGELVEEFIKPDSELLDETFTFDSTKLYLSPTGYIYVLKGQSILAMDAYNQFRGYIGQTQIGFSLIDSLLRIFASDQQKKMISKRTAEAYTNITMDEKGTIYATSLDRSEGEIKKLNSVGKNIYRKYGSNDSEPKFLEKLFGSFNRLNLREKSFTFGETRDDNGNPIKPVFKDIAVGENGIITVIEEQTGKLYQYDQEGNLLTVFGGKGDQKGRFVMPSSIVNDNEGRIYVLDRSTGNIQMFEPTEFIKAVHKAVEEYSKGKYNEAYDIWGQILLIDENYQMGHFGLANALYKQEKWKDAMNEYMMADDRTGYSKAYTEYRYDTFRQYFAIVVLALSAIITALVLFIKWIKGLSLHALEEFRNTHSKKVHVATGLKMAFGVIFHPVETFEEIKNGRGKLNLVPGVIILLSVLAARIFYLFVVHYPLADIDLKDSNIWLEAVKLLLPVITWVIASFAITAILDSESKISEIFLATTYCMVPYILVTFPLAVLSRILTRNEASFYGFILNCTWIWILLLFFISLRTLNDYSISRTAAAYAISGGTMVLIWFVSLLGYTLTGKLYQFISGIIYEIRMTWL